MAIEIRELIIKVRIEESAKASSEEIDLYRLEQNLLKACRKEIKKQLNNTKYR